MAPHERDLLAVRRPHRIVILPGGELSLPGAVRIHGLETADDRVRDFPVLSRVGSMSMRREQQSYDQRCHSRELHRTNTPSQGLG